MLNNEPVICVSQRASGSQQPVVNQQPLSNSQQWNYTSGTVVSGARKMSKGANQGDDDSYQMLEQLRSNRMSHKLQQMNNDEDEDDGDDGSSSSEGDGDAGKYLVNYNFTKKLFSAEDDAEEEAQEAEAEEMDADGGDDNDDEEEAELAEAEMMNEQTAIDAIDTEEKFNADGGDGLDFERVGAGQGGQKGEGQNQTTSQAKVISHIIIII